MRIAIIVIAVFLAVSAFAYADKAPESRPVVIVFDTVQGEHVDKALAKSATNALCTYLRETQRVEAIVFDRESPTVLRAIMEKQITADQVASYSSQDERIRVAKALDYDYAAGSDLSIKDGAVTVKVWIAKANGAKKDRWETHANALTGTTGDRGYDNAVQSATSASVISLAREAFLGLPSVPDKEPTNDSQTTAIKADMMTAPNPPTAGDYAGHADTSMKAGKVALAIQQYQQAVSADPTNPALRLKLADAYIRRSMRDEAAAEIDAAEKMGASADKIAAARNQLGQPSSVPVVKADYKDLSEPPKASPQVKSAPVPPAPDEAKNESASAISKMREGDKLWRANQPDEAADAYKEAIKLNPSDWRAYERLALVDASMSLFSESRVTLGQLAKVQPNPSSQTITSRYKLFSSVFEQWFASMLKQLDRDSADYEKKIISRESYYNSVKGLGLRLESMAKFLDALPCPEDKKTSNLHRSLACGMLTQATSSFQDYLETNNADSKANADTFVVQAKKELDTVKALEVVK